MQILLLGLDMMDLKKENKILVGANKILPGTISRKIILKTNKK